MAAKTTENVGDDHVFQASIPIMPDSPPLRPHSSSSPPLEASATTFCHRPAVDPPVDSDDEDVDEALVVDSPSLLSRSSGSRVHPSSPPLYGPLLEQSPPNCYSSDHQRSKSSSSLANLQDSMDTPPPPPPLNQRQPQPDDDVEVPPTPKSKPRTSPTFADIVKHSSAGKNHHQQPQGHKLKSIIIDPSRREVHSRRADLRVRFADSPHMSSSATRSSYSASSGIDSSRNTWWRKVEYPQEELHPSPTHRSSNDGRTPRLSPRIRKIIEGRCFICLARGHWAAACRHPITCFRCRRPGHRERDCHQRHQHPRQSAMPSRPPPPLHLPWEEQSLGHQNDCHTERLHPRSNDSIVQHLFTEHANYFQHEIKKMLNTMIQSLRSEFSLLFSVQMQKLQESNEKWMKLAENLVLQMRAMTEKLKTLGSNEGGTIAGMQAHDDRLDQLHDTPLHLKLAMSKATATTPSQETESLGDQHHRPKEIAPSGSPMKVATTFNKIKYSLLSKSTIPEVTIQDVEDALLQIEIAAAKEPPLNSVSCCSPTHIASGGSDSLLLSLPSTNVEPFSPAIQPEEQTTCLPAQTLDFAAVESTVPTPEITASSHVLACHHIENTELEKPTSETTVRLRRRRCRFRPGCVYTRRPRCGSERHHHGFGAAADAEPCIDIGGQGHSMSPSLEEGGPTAHELALANFIQSVTVPVQQPLLPLLGPQQHGSVKPRREKKRPDKPSRRSTRLAAIAWPRGDAQSKARQVLMKRLGVTQEEGGTMGMTLLRYINLFKGPMSDLVIKALVALSGLDGPTISRKIMT